MDSAERGNFFDRDETPLKSTERNRQSAKLNLEHELLKAN